MRAALLLVLSPVAFAQSTAAMSGRISGQIVDEFDNPVSGASVVAENALKQEFKATSGANGEYSIDKLPAGVYELTATLLTMKNFLKKDIAVGAAGVSRVNVKMVSAGGQTLGTLGDGDRFSAAFFAAQKTPPPPVGPTPRLADGTPDLSGFWVSSPAAGPGQPQGPRPEPPDALPWAEAIRQERQASKLRDDPYGRCLPRGIMSWAGQGKFVHTPAILVLLITGEPPRQVFLDGRGHPKDVNPTWQGHSVGHWEGDTLVVDTVGFNGLAWFQTLPSTEMLHIVERYRRIDLGHLETEITVEDPPVLRKPWTQKRISNLDPNGDNDEYICTENNKDVEHMVGK